MNKELKIFTAIGIFVGFAIVVIVSMYLPLFSKSVETNNYTSKSIQNNKLQDTNSNNSIEYEEQRVLSQKEKIEYIKQDTPKNTILRAIIDGDSIECNIDLDGSSTIIEGSEGNIKITTDYLRNPVTYVITNSGIWLWETNGVNIYKSITSEDEKITLISMLGISELESEELFNESCEYKPIKQDTFKIPDNIEFVEE